MSLKLRYLQVFFYFLFLSVVSTHAASAIVERLESAGSEFQQKHDSNRDITYLVMPSFAGVIAKSRGEDSISVVFGRQSLSVPVISYFDKPWSISFFNSIKISNYENDLLWAMNKENPLVIPLPGSVWLFGSGLVVLIGFLKHFKK